MPGDTKGIDIGYRNKDREGCTPSLSGVSDVADFCLFCFY
jgi:hypothetical protein